MTAPLLCSLEGARDVGAIGLLALIVFRALPEFGARLDRLTTYVVAVAKEFGVEVPDEDRDGRGPKGPTSGWARVADAMIGGPMRKLAWAVVVAAVALSGCAATEGATVTAKRAVCAFGDGVATATRIFCNEPVGAPTASAQAQPTSAGAAWAMPTAQPAPVVPASGPVPAACEGGSCAVEATAVRPLEVPPRDEGAWWRVPWTARR